MYKTNNSIKIHKAKAIAMQGEIARAYQQKINSLMLIHTHKTAYTYAGKKISL